MMYKGVTGLVSLWWAILAFSASGVGSSDCGLARIVFRKGYHYNYVIQIAFVGNEMQDLSRVSNAIEFVE